MSNKLFAAALSCTLLIAGCKTPTQVNEGPIKAATFSFFRPGPLPEAASSENRQQMHGLGQQAISNDLTGKGLQKAADNGDVTIAYLVITGNNASTSSINDYFGYTDDAASLARGVHKAYTESDRRDYFEAGTLIIDLLDSRTHELLFRNHVTRSVLRNASLDVRQARIQEAVNAALKELRVEH